MLVAIATHTLDSAGVSIARKFEAFEKLLDHKLSGIASASITSLA